MEKRNNTKKQVQVFKIVKPQGLGGVFLPYHTMNPAQAIERILGSKNLI
jgi:hypothetical protein